MGFLIIDIFILKDTNSSFFVSEINNRLHPVLNCTPKQLSIENKNLFKTCFPWLVIKLLRDIARFVGRLVRGNPCALFDPNFYSYGNALWVVERVREYEVAGRAGVGLALYLNTVMYCTLHEIPF